ncbi:MFS transporter [Nocardia sp. NPDC051570]|uniref:MFS transporter n=1 Tax=Nocardia sp. NPDC051570 TaxID=3364324 RepID=UPI0037984751
MRRYWRVLRIGGVRPTLLFGLFAKFPMIAIPIVMTLHVSLGLGRSLAEAGLATGGWLLGVTVGSPLQGWTIDRWGVRRVLLVSACAQTVFWAMAGTLNYQLLVLFAAVSGLLLVPGSTPIRLVLTAVVPEGDRQAAFAIDSMLTELSYMAGPALGVLLATQFSTQIATRAVGCSLVLGLVLLAVAASGTAPAPAPGGTPRGRMGFGMIAALSCAFIAGTLTSGFEVSVVGLMNSHHAVHWVGLVILACGGYALLGGLIFGALRVTFPAWLVTALLGVVTIPIGLVPDWRFLLLAVGPAAALSAAAFIATANTVSQAAPPDRRGRTIGLYGTALFGGNAAGAPLAGAANTVGGAEAGFAVVGVLAVLVALAASRAHRPPSAADPTVVAAIAGE